MVWVGNDGCCGFSSVPSHFFKHLLLSPQPPLYTVRQALIVISYACFCCLVWCVPCNVGLVFFYFNFSRYTVVVGNSEGVVLSGDFKEAVGTA
jgi:hypothetical protein